MPLPWTTAQYVFSLFIVLFAGCVAASPRPTLRLLFGRHAHEASDERIRVLRILAAAISAVTAMQVLMRLIGQPFD